MSTAVVLAREIETRAQWAARMFLCFEDWRAQEICREKGCTPEQIAAARVAGWALKDARDLDYRINGRPEYGR